MPVNVKQKPKRDKRPVVGLDISTKTGFVRIHSFGAVEAEEIAVAPAENAMGRMMRADVLYKELRQRLTAATPQLIVIEGYSFASKFNNMAQVELGAVARLCCFHLAIPFVEISPTSLKKFITGVGKGDKNVIMMHVLKKWGFEPATDNIADAYGLARMGLCMAGLEKPLAYENNVLEQIGKKGRKNTKK